MHFINRSPQLRPPQIHIATFVSDVADIEVPSEDVSSASYADVPWTDQVKADDECVSKVRLWLDSLLRPDGISNLDYAAFIRFAMKFFVHDGKLWRKDSSGCHKLVATPASRYTMLVSAHDDVAHKGFYATHGLIAERFWWPAMRGDIAWFIRTCRLCQLRQTC